jgi:hypothetical protein
VKRVDAHSYDAHKARRDDHKCLLFTFFCPDHRVVDQPPFCRKNSVFKSAETEVSSEEDGCGEFVLSQYISVFLHLTVYPYLLSPVDGAAAVPSV